MGRESVMDSFFTDYERMMRDTGLIDKPERVYNIDETWFDPRKEHNQKVVVPKGCKMPYKVFSGYHAHLSLTMCISAAGKWLPPMFTFQNNLPKNDEFHVSGPENAYYTISESGHIDSQLYLGYIKHLEKFLDANRPVVILQDNHSAHESNALIEFCRAKGIHLYNFPPKLTHVIQPLDKLFNSFKETYQRQKEKAMYVHQQNIAISKIPILTKFAMNDTKRDTIKDTFSITGCFPVNRRAIDNDLLVADGPSSIKHTPHTKDPIATSLAMEVFEEGEDSQLINNTRFIDSTSQTDPLASFPCSECIQRDVMLHPAVASGAVSVELARAFIPDQLTAVKSKDATHRRREKSQRWLTSDSEAARRQKDEQNKQEAENAKNERKKMKEQKRKDKEEIEELRKQLTKEKKEERQKLKEEANMYVEGKVSHGRCSTCLATIKRKSPDITQCIICNVQYHKNCVDALSYVTVCKMCFEK